MFGGGRQVNLTVRGGSVIQFQKSRNDRSSRKILYPLSRARSCNSWLRPTVTEIFSESRFFFLSLSLPPFLALIFCMP